MKWEEVWGILKWVLAALAAGFIGQFGRSVALHLMHRRRDKRAQQAGRETRVASSNPAPVNGEDEQAAARQQIKLEKKRAKAKVKRLKKS